jgi:hypothetical protein
MVRFISVFSLSLGYFVAGGLSQTSCPGAGVESQMKRPPQFLQAKGDGEP